jgi:DnaJ family protein C protein 3
LAGSSHPLHLQEVASLFAVFINFPSLTFVVEHRPEIRELRLAKLQLNMIVRLQNLVLLGAFVAGVLLPATTAEPFEIPADTPISSLISSAKAARALGKNTEALAYFDAAVNRDSSDYLTLFQRGATYLSQGRSAPARADFDRVLGIKPGFEGALVQRAKLKARGAEWAAAKQDYKAAGKTQELVELEEAEGAAYLAEEAEKKQDWEMCVQQAGVAITTAGAALSLRQLRARCRFARGEIQEGVSDLAHVLQMHPGQVQPHLQMSSMLFYSLGETEKGLTQIKKCLHSDPDSKACKALFRQEKSTNKSIEKIAKLMESRQFNSASKLLVGVGEEPGLLKEIQESVAELKADGSIHANAPNDLYARFVEKTCECYRETKSTGKAAIYCPEALQLVPNSLHGLLFQAQSQLDAENYDAAIGTLNTAKEHHPGANIVQQKLQEAQVALKRSKQKDYYKVLGVSKDAEEREIKKAYRKIIKTHHPDKIQGQGVTKDEAEKKMARINEAYEVLSDPELKARFDRGEDPNDPMANQGGNPFQGSPFGGQQFVFQQGGQQFQFRQSGGGGGGGGGGNPFQGFPFG